MYFDPSLSAALDRIAERAADVRRAYVPGAVPAHDDVETAKAVSDFTLDPLSVAAPENAYFVTNDEHGRRAYTRDGSFAFRGGKLVDADGTPVLGIRVPGGPLAELSVDPVDEALGRMGNAGIDRDGTVFYQRESVDPRSRARESQRVALGRLALARFPAGTRLECSDASHSVAPTGVVPQTGVAGDGRFGPLALRRRERSRIDLDQSIMRLKDAYLAFDALQAAQAAKAHLGKTAMDLLK
jgi:flagellar basal body rod protein FlgG